MRNHRDSAANSPAKDPSSLTRSQPHPAVMNVLCAYTYFIFLLFPIPEALIVFFRERAQVTQHRDVDARQQWAERVSASCSEILLLGIGSELYQGSILMRARRSRAFIVSRSRASLPMIEIMAVFLCKRSCTPTARGCCGVYSVANDAG